MPLTASDIVRCATAHEVAIGYRSTQCAVAGYGEENPRDEGHPEAPKRPFLPNNLPNAQPKKSVGNVETATVSAEREGGADKANALAYTFQRESQTAECLATNP